METVMMDIVQIRLVLTLFYFCGAQFTARSCRNNQVFITVAYPHLE